MNIKKILTFIALITGAMGIILYIAKKKKEEEMQKYGYRKKACCCSDDSEGEGGDISEKEVNIGSFYSAYVADLNPKNAKKFIDDSLDAVIVDVSSNYNEKHIPGAISAPIKNGSLEDQMKNWDKKGTYLIYGSSDEESADALDMFVSEDFERVFRLSGGLDAWENAGYEVEKPGPEQSCCYTISTSDGTTDHTHRWCEGEDTTEEYIDPQKVRHSHLIDEDKNIALLGGKEPHTHQLKE